MKNGKLLSASATLLVGLAAPALADWDPNDGHKMHYPQLPDPLGLDISFRSPQVLADDWRCSWTGPVDDIHFWFSALGDGPVVIYNVHVSIHANIPESPDNPFSRPGALLWQRDYGPDEVTWRPAGMGPQGWYVPENGYYQPLDHYNYYQMNITEIDDPFYQYYGQVYWLDISISSLVPLGWKTSGSPQFMDTAVWGILPEPEWQPVYDPRYPGSNTRLDLAFVITPEPGALLLLALLGACARPR